MPKPGFIPAKLKPWIEARKRYGLSHAQVQMARELGLNPKKSGKLANTDEDAILPLCFPPYGWWPLLLLSFPPLLLATTDTTPQRAFYLGMLHGMLGYGFALYWGRSSMQSPVVIRHGGRRISTCNMHYSSGFVQPKTRAGWRVPRVQGSLRLLTRGATCMRAWLPWKRESSATVSTEADTRRSFRTAVGCSPG